MSLPSSMSSIDSHAIFCLVLLFSDCLCYFRYQNVTKYRGLITDKTPMELYESCPDIIAPLKVIQTALRIGSLGEKYWIEQSTSRAHFLTRKFYANSDDKATQRKGTQRSSVASTTIDRASSRRSANESQSRYSITDDEMTDYYTSINFEKSGATVVPTQNVDHGFMSKLMTSMAPSEFVINESYSRDSTVGNLASVKSNSDIKFDNAVVLSPSGEVGELRMLASEKNNPLDRLRREEDDQWNSGYSSLTDSDFETDYKHNTEREIIQVSQFGIRRKSVANPASNITAIAFRRGQVVPMVNTAF
jgi:hypothetical protein